MLTHLSNTTFPRLGFLRGGTDRVGGKLALWGVSAPRPPEHILRQWPYDYSDLCRRFQNVEKCLGVPDQIPDSGKELEMRLLERLRGEFESFPVCPAPVAINDLGHRWSPLDEVPSLTQRGIQLISRFECTGFEQKGDRLTAVRGRWGDGEMSTLQARVVVMAWG